MFTSRAEHRLILRQDNARFRLFEHAKDLGLVSADYVRDTDLVSGQISAERERLRSVRRDGKSLEEILRRPGVSYSDPDALPTCLTTEAYQCAPPARFIIHGLRTSWLNFRIR